MKSKANLGYTARPCPQHKELGFTQKHVLHTATPPWLGQGKITPGFLQQLWIQANIPGITRVPLLRPQGPNSMITEVTVLEVQKKEFCQSLLQSPILVKQLWLAKTQPATALKKRFGNKLATQPPFLPPLLPNRVSLSPPPGPFVLLS